MVANIDCHLDRIWNQLRDGLWETLVTVFLDEIIQSGNLQMRPAISDDNPYKTKPTGKVLHSFASLPLGLFGVSSTLSENSSI